MSLHAERARDLLDALDALVQHRTAEPEAYRAVHAAATAAIGALHDQMLDPRAGDFDADVTVHADLARRLRTLPRPTTGQPSGRSSADPLAALLGRARGTGATIDALLGDVASGVAPQLERALREGLRDLVTRLGRPEAGHDVDDAGRDTSTGGGLTTDDPWDDAGA